MAQKSPISARPSTGASAADREFADWPRDEGGRPQAKITVGVKEKVGLKDYSNVDIGPFSITMFVPFGVPDPLSDDEKAALASAVNQVAEVIEVEVAAYQRDVVLNTIDPAKR